MTPGRHAEIRAICESDIRAGWGDDRMYGAAWTPREILALLDAAEELERIKTGAEAVLDQHGAMGDLLRVTVQLANLQSAARALVAGAKDGVREESLLGLIADVEMALREEAQP